MTKIYFKNFNALRAIAASLVVFAHIIQFKKEASLNSPINWIPLGTIAVTLFFVLSGFLITYLLLKEKEATQNISLKKFYIRRILRIWPLYFVILILGYIMFYEGMGLEALILSVLFLPNIALTYHMLPDAIDPIWSIGIEEQFYLILPFLVLFSINIKKLTRTFVILIIGLIILKYVASYLSNNSFFNFINDYLYLARYDSMFIGGLGAIWFFNSKGDDKIAKIIFSTPFQLFSYLSILILFYLNLYLEVPVIHQLYSIFFLLIILNLGTNNFSILNIENKVMTQLGKLSYSLYLTHKLTIFFLFDRCFIFTNQNKWLTIFIVYILSIIIAQVCYLGIEKYFLKYKSRFEVMKTS